jgi:hypothetical protein
MAVRRESFVDKVFVERLEVYPKYVIYLRFEYSAVSCLGRRRREISKLGRVETMDVAPEPVKMGSGSS